MANNDKIQQIVSNIKLLNDLTNSMIDSEIYPVSFFSQAFDLMQKIQGDFHKLEAGQVELFASQMKKHQALILSIHQQMRHIDATTADPPAASTVPKAAQSSVTGQAPFKKEVIAGQQEDKQKKGSFLSRLGIAKEPATHKAPVREPAANTKSAADPSPVAKTEGVSGRTSPQTISETQSPVKKTDVPPVGPASKSIEAPIRVPTTKPFAEKTLPEKDLPVEKTPAPATSETVKRTAKSTITLPESSTERITRPLRPEGGQTPYGTSKTPEPKAANASGRIPAEGSAPPSVNDAMEKRKLSDLRKAFSLNDRFLYRRELFGGNEDVMNRVITALNNKTSYKESILFLEEKLHWDFTNPTVKDFIKILEIRFL
ncbi:MAG: hypothetical protein LBG28_00105 [Tannerella sp.]|jgi:hypothetical protein|nr:hypothetical protein [Tannerella sp.]